MPDTRGAMVTLYPWMLGVGYYPQCLGAMVTPSRMLGVTMVLPSPTFSCTEVVEIMFSLT